MRNIKKIFINFEGVWKGRQKLGKLWYFISLKKQISVQRRQEAGTLENLEGWKGRNNRQKPS